MTDTYIEKHDREIINKTLQQFSDFLDLQKKRLEADPLNLISQKKIMEQLHITAPTLYEWEKMGLKKFKAPEGRKVWYLKEDVLAFLEEGGK
ncbi:hypothetical protein HMPREF9318_01575 [Streptococcus urinalis FB127-CNA-2]|uniref:Helix-turn-helix domain-containing protein n=1 Tax=Streptococcus urinalis 2285-97 TaxID=764291 RepID=G5KFK6_9STRE|nr:hypothetical protein [Streptococcus urinalis]QBX12171.1 hypothetical protein JavanS644_0007 [Streptococcus satellite phage Javan644]QBX12199.1 hypothetical protein JavanS647_0007 [Streptococcus satellite phage Javan647]QBX12212.1 hypothetical protein JavanS649_0007 [Streptococcus satellite phage Javan649]EHJ56669.1 hypothetical protein STRUR_2273 [Streptococcus urinalis 2285-97]EKS19179.1 hypothetical protein HMPREF9318_01575 [Streptococcus urinalis FB127-CNA-2]